jgi:hypothetical protein
MRSHGVEGYRRFVHLGSGLMPKVDVLSKA